MNYRHHYHAGNFADVVKHALLIGLIEALQRKPKPCVFLDTHAGRGRYDLLAADRGDSLARTPEWPDGIGRLWSEPAADDLLARYVALVRRFGAERGGDEATLRWYPGSPWIAAALARPEDRLVLCEKHPDDFASLAAAFAGRPRVSVLPTDGYAAVRATLPSRERRALVLIDPPYEAQDEIAQIGGALRDGLGRLPSAVFAIWYPLTGRARTDEFVGMLRRDALAPTLTCEVEVAVPADEVKLRGCGLAVINPPWQFDATARPLLTALAVRLAAPAAPAPRLEWVVPER
jgi:23S rRNA (adenine2030-N6)-methyltransferase